MTTALSTGAIAAQTVCPCCGKPFDASKLSLDSRTNTVLYKNKQTRLTPTQARLFAVLLKSRPEVAKRRDLIAALYGAKQPRSAQHAMTNLSVQIMKLRDLLGPLKIEIVSVWGIGFKLEEFEVKKREEKGA